MKNKILLLLLIIVIVSLIFIHVNSCKSMEGYGQSEEEIELYKKYYKNIDITLRHIKLYAENNMNNMRDRQGNNVSRKIKEKLNKVPIPDESETDEKTFQKFITNYSKYIINDRDSSSLGYYINNTIDKNIEENAKLISDMLNIIKNAPK